MKTEEIIIKTEAYYALQKIRVQAELRRKSFVRDKRLDKKEAAELHQWSDAVLKQIEQNIITGVANLIEDIPIYTEFLKKIKGIGVCLGASLYAGIYDIKRFAMISKLWKYCGMDVVDGEAPRRKKGEKITWNPFLRMSLYKITDSFIKQNPDKSQYRRLYDEFKTFYQKKFPQWEFCWNCNSHMIPAKSGIGMKCIKCKGDQAGEPHPTRKTKDGKPIFRYTRNHVHNMAKRKVAKIFMEHLFVAWWELETGTVPTKPWIMTQPGHSHYIPCEEIAA